MVKMVMLLLKQNKKSLKFSFFFIFFFIFQVQGFSQELKIETEVQKIEEIVITAKRKEEKKFDTDRSIEVLEKNEIEKIQGETLPDSLTETTGVYVQKTNTGAGAPIIRGLIGPQNLILIDGVRFNNSVFRTGPNQYLALIDPWGIEKIEILRGPGSVLYGSDAMGGIIHVFTKGIKLNEKYVHPTAIGRFHSADKGAEVVGEIQGGFGRFGVIGGGSYKNFGELRAGEGKKQLLSDFSGAFFRFKNSIGVGKGWTLTPSYLGARIWDAGRVDEIGKGDVRFYDNSDDFLYVRLKKKGKEIFKHLEFNLSYHYFTETTDRYSCQTDDKGSVKDLNACSKLDEATLTKKRVYDDKVHTFGSFVEVNSHFFKDKLRLSYGGEGYFDYVKSSLMSGKKDDNWTLKPEKRGHFSEGSKYYTSGIYLYGEGDLLNFKDKYIFTLAGGARGSFFGARAKDIPEIGDINYDYQGVVFTGGLRFLYLDKLNLYFNFSQGFRAPNLQETTELGDTGSKFEIPNPSLGPEKSNTFEVGTKVNYGIFGSELTFFYSIIGDMIVDVSSQWQGQKEIEGKPVAKRINSDEAKYKGIEGTFYLNKLWRFKPFLGLTYIHGDVRSWDDKEKVFKTAPARRVPPLFGKGGILYEHPNNKFFVELYSLFSLKQDRLNPLDEKDLRICEVRGEPGVTYKTKGLKCPGTDGWATINLRGGWNFTKWGSFFLSLTNITDAYYKYHTSGVYAPGFSLSTTFKISI